MDKAEIDPKLRDRRLQEDEVGDGTRDDGRLIGGSGGPRRHAASSLKTETMHFVVRKRASICSEKTWRVISPGTML